MSAATAKPYHVYAVDGFESAHSSEAAAVRAAKRGVAARGVAYEVIKCSVVGYSGGGHGEVIWSSATTTGGAS